MKLFLRLGALLQAKLTVTELALEQALDHAGGKRLLSDRRLKDATTVDFPALLRECEALDSGLTLIDETRGAETGWRVIALDDELDNPLLARAAESSAPPSEAPPLGELVATLAPALRGPVEGLLAARADDQRAAALEQLRYAMPPLAVVSELMPMLLADAAELVRERAIGLLVASGANIAVVDLIRALQRRDEAALARAGENVANLPIDQQDLAVAALMATLSRGYVSQGLINLCQRLAAHLSGYRGLDRLIELLLPSRLSLLGLVRALQEHDAERIDGLLQRRLGQGAEQDTAIIILLAAPGRRADDAILERGIDLLLSADEAPHERMGLASALRRLDQGAEGGRIAALIAKRAAVIAAARDTSVFWLLAECCRDRTVDAATAEQLAIATRKLLRDAPGPHLVALLEQQLPALLPASDSARAALVEPLVEVVARFRDERSLDLVANCLIGIGPAATSALWALFEDHPHQNVRLLAAELLPGLLEPASVEVRLQAARRLLAGLARAEQARERGALITAAARLAAGDDMPAEIAIEVDQATQAGLGEWAIEALGHLAASRHCPAERRTAILDQLLAHLLEDLPDAPVQQVRDPATDDVTFVLDDRLGAHTENVPRLLLALHRIGQSAHLPENLLQRLVERLCTLWRRVSNWHTIWGPGNIQELGHVLGKLAGRPRFPGPLRVVICESLLPKLSQLSIARSLARVFVVAEGAYLSELAGRASERLVQLAADKYYAEDEWPDLAETLTDFLVIPHLGGRGESTRRRLVNLICAYRTQCTSRARAKLRALLPDLTEELRNRLDWV